jgi:hypothetical protein
MFFYFGPILCYFILLGYAGFASQWAQNGDNFLYEYLVILSWYYQLWIAYKIYKLITKSAS